MRELIRRNLRFFILVSLAALALRLLFVLRFPGVVTDSFVYGDIAKNWLQHGIYGLSGPDEISPTYIRLPGYPAFLALMFAMFGVDHYRAILIAQMFVDLGTCFLCADIARRLLDSRVAKLTCLLAALCPFLADYSAAALTETFEVFFTALGLDRALAALQNGRRSDWIWCGAACAGAILFRPDGALLLIALLVYLLASSVRFRDASASAVQTQKIAPLSEQRSSLQSRIKYLQAAAVVLMTALVPPVPWAIRNWTVFHRFQPLAPRYANEEDEFVPMGFNHWTKTWIADYVSVEEIYWPVPGSKIDATQLPSRAFDSTDQQIATIQVIDGYNNELHVTPELDEKFQSLANQRTWTHPLRYYVGLPLLRILDMWLRPRTEMLPCDSRWWEFNDEPKWSALAVGFGATNLAFVICAMVGWLKFRKLPLMGLVIVFVLLRSAFLGTLENPEPRYTLEMYPVVIVFAAAALTGSTRKQSSL